ncbi:MAG: hypothetical protein H7145_03050 [Akkermansiaceae bacterium]|nr:hypothetical protein [Armatimonadota bacterium]
MSTTPPPLLSLRRQLLLLFVFLFAVFVAHQIAQWGQNVSPIPLGIGRWFPVSYGHPRIPSFLQATVALLSVVGFAGAVRFLPHLPERRRYGVAALIGFLSILATTATHGTERGFAHPVAGREPRAAPIQYWHDAEAQRITTGAGALRFVRDYRTVQPTLAEHGRTHPPGAVLFFALLRQASGNRPALAAVVVCLIAVTLVAVGFRHAGAPPFVLLLFCALPAVQVYFCATLDAVIAGLLFIAVTAVRVSPPAPNAGGDGGHRAELLRSTGDRPPAFYPAPPAMGAGGLWKTFLALLAASFLTFGVVWVVPVLFAVETAQTRRFPWRSVSSLLAVALCYSVLYALTGFDYFVAFRFASVNENPDGFRLLVSPPEYVATRLENIADFLFFAGPFALWAAWRGLSAARREDFLVWVMFVAGVASLALLFLAGAYRTGETGRACLFLYPLLALVAARHPLSDRDRETLLIATFGVSAALQCAGFYFW